MKPLIGNIRPSDLRDADIVAGLKLTKGQASQLITILNEEAERTGARAA